MHCSGEGFLLFNKLSKLLSSLNFYPLKYLNSLNSLSFLDSLVMANKFKIKYGVYVLLSYFVLSCTNVVLAV